MDQVITLDNISRDSFYNDYVKPGRPLRIRKATAAWKALKIWNADYFKSIEGDLKLAAKNADVASGKRETLYLSEYVSLLEEHERQLRDGKCPPQPLYLHDVPIFHLLPSLVQDIEPFPLELLPKWYWKNWHNYIQFFMGATGSLTPLHFDTLYTHNLFFQVAGRKKFILIPGNQKAMCYIKGWRWSDFDPARPDYERFPEAKGLTPVEVVLEPGDVLYIPSGMLHQVHGLSYSISFNIDWHTPRSAGKGVFSLFEGAPRKNIYYNSLILLGVGLKVPPKIIFPYYKSYLNYIS
ncbi:cupin-like domain-containing protein [Chitinophaga sp. 22536]|uniref:cupin-like domain-containing protein n=1 Tax=unclassified Chitinophaga TaxID=2619133 RepID=UPI003F85DD11